MGVNGKPVMNQPFDKVVERIKKSVPTLLLDVVSNSDRESANSSLNPVTGGQYYERFMLVNLLLYNAISPYHQLLSRGFTVGSFINIFNQVCIHFLITVIAIIYMNAII